MATASTNEQGIPVCGSQFFITLSDKHLDYLDGKYCIVGKVAEGLDILEQINDTLCDDNGVPYKDIRIMHTVILDDPFDDPSGLVEPDRSPVMTAEMLRAGRLGNEADETKDFSLEESEALAREREAEARALTLEMIGDLPFAEAKPPENILFICKLNRHTRDEDLELIFSRFGKIVRFVFHKSHPNSCEIVRDKETGRSLKYAFIEFEDKEACEEAYFKMVCQLMTHVLE